MGGIMSRGRKARERTSLSREHFRSFPDSIHIDRALVPRQRLPIFRSRPDLAGDRDMVTILNHAKDYQRPSLPVTVSHLCRPLSAFVSRSTPSGV